MITVSVRNLLSAIEEAEEFSLPEMNEGTQYLYNELYGKGSKGMEIHLSEIDFDRFKLEDVDMIRDIHSDILEANESKADALANSFAQMRSSAVAADFV